LFQNGISARKTGTGYKKNESGLPFEINKTDVVKLVKNAWKVSFETNRKAVLHRGWGPKALNMNVLRNPEILATKPNSTKDLTGTSQGLTSKITPMDLNINEGLVGTLVDCIVLESNKYATERGSSIAEITRKQKETALKRLENHEKRCTAGLLASAGKFSLGLDVLERQRHIKQMEEEKQRQKQLRAKDLYDVLLVKVQAIRSKNLPAEKWTSSELNTMIQWHKRPDDAAMPSKKADKLARYYDICGRGDPVAPTLPIELVPPAQLEEDDDDELPPLPAPDLDINNGAVDAAAILAIVNLDLDAAVDNVGQPAAIWTAPNLDLDAADPAAILTVPNIELAPNTDAAVDEMLEISEALLLFASANEAMWN
jgi:hypothetical protein